MTGSAVRDEVVSGVVPRLGAVVLCGGHSRRMGRPKAWLPFGDEVLLQRVVRRVAEAASPIVVVASPGQAVPDLPPAVRVVRDPVADRGPLQGIAAGLEALAGTCDDAFASSTDAPFVAPELIRRLAALRRGGALDAAVPRAGGHLHPLCAVYALTVSSAIEPMLAAGTLRLLSLLDLVRTLVADEAALLADPALAAADPALRSLMNVNTPEDYEAALRDAGLGPPAGP